MTFCLSTPKYEWADILWLFANVYIYEFTISSNIERTKEVNIYDANIMMDVGQFELNSEGNLLLKLDCMYVNK